MQSCHIQPDSDFIDFDFACALIHYQYKITVIGILEINVLPADE
jgi:hypothetical protein